MGYQSVLQQELSWRDLVPEGWTPEMAPASGLKRRDSGGKRICCSQFGHWSVWRRDPKFNNTTDPAGFSFLFFSEEMSVIYQGLYCRLSVAPNILAIIQPGAIGGEWENVTSSDSFFKKVVASSKAGLPEYLLYGGFGRGFYDAACWDEYQGERLAQLPERYAGLWKLNTTNNTTH